jgi:hypothetical protein
MKRTVLVTLYSTCDFYANRGWRYSGQNFCMEVHEMQTNGMPIVYGKANVG